MHGRVRVDFEDLSLSAHRTHNPSVLYDQFAMPQIILQGFSLTFLEMSIKTN